MKTKVSIYNLSVIPYIIADRAAWNVMEEDKRCKDMRPHEMQDISDKANNLLCDRSELHFKQKGQFYKGMLNKRNDERYYLEMFMEHWFKHLLDQHFRGEEMTFERLTTFLDHKGYVGNNKQNTHISKYGTPALEHLNSLECE